jgi:signal transduction histidine kinase
MANGIELRPGSNSRYIPTGDAAVFDGVDASPEELILDASRREATTTTRLALMQRYALSGLATEMTTHEANSLLRRLTGYADHFVASQPDDRTSHFLAEDALRLKEDFDFLCRFRASRDAYGHHTPGKLLEVVRFEFEHALRRGDLVIEATDAFMNAEIGIASRVIDAVLINLVRNSYYWGSDAGQRPVVVRFDVEQVEHEVDTWDDDTETCGKMISVSDIIVVEDNGPGLPDGIGDEIFEVGVSGRRSSGIGLHICRTGLESQGKTIVADPERSEIGGARFRIGPRSLLRPEYVPYEEEDTPRELELAEAVEAISALIANGDNVEAARLSDVYEEAAGLAMRIRLRGAETNLEERLVAAVEGFHAQLGQAQTPAGTFRS